MTPEVEKAVEEIKTLFKAHKVDVEPVADGGARVIVHDVQLSEKYNPQITWVGFIIGFQYPRADVYPHHIDHSVKRTDGNPLGEAFSGPVKWQDRDCIQISRKSNKLDPSVDTAATKLAKVIEWMKSR